MLFFIGIVILAAGIIIFLLGLCNVILHMFKSAFQYEDLETSVCHITFALVSTILGLLVGVGLFCLGADLLNIPFPFH